MEVVNEETLARQKAVKKAKRSLLIKRIAFIGFGFSFLGLLIALAFINWNAGVYIMLMIIMFNLGGIKNNTDTLKRASVTVNGIMK
jgi:hypothetical protein